MEVNITYEKEDWLKFQGFLEKELPKRNKATWDSVLINLAIWALIGAIAMFVFKEFDYFHWPTAGFVGVVAILIFIQIAMEMNRVKYYFMPSESGCFIGSHRIVLNESGIESSGNGYNSFHAWSGVKEIVRENGLIMLFLDTAYAYTFPEHKLDDPDALYNYVKECLSAPVA